MRVEPFLKWPGGKRWLARKLANCLAPRIHKRYFEPFLGGGAVFFALSPTLSTLSDVNSDLINTYTQVRDCPEELIQRLQRLPVSSETYYQMRASSPDDPTDQAVKLLYLNRTAFGGIYRLNQHGEFNVPYGGGERTPAPLWTNKLLIKASQALQGAIIEASDFEPIMDLAGEGDVIYCDPTYTVAHEYNNFRRYNERNFSWHDQERLAQAAKRAYQRGALVLVSNASHASLLGLYAPFQPFVLERKSLVSKKREARRNVNEFLFVLDPTGELHLQSLIQAKDEGADYVPSRE